jgi:hypothetical protein
LFWERRSRRMSRESRSKPEALRVDAFLVRGVSFWDGGKWEWEWEWEERGEWTYVGVLEGVQLVT